MSEMVLPATVEDAWAEYHAYIDDTRRRLLARPDMQDPAMQAMANMAIANLIAGGMQFYMMPRQDCPVFHRDAVWSPIYPWGGPASDILYHWTFLDGAHDYRITVTPGTTLFTDFHLFENYIGAEDMRNLGNYDLDGFTPNADGTIEIVASAREHDGNWMKLDESVHNIAIQVREFWWDWESERGVHLSIERIDDGSVTMRFAGDDFIRRLHLAGRSVEQFILRSLGYAKMAKKMADGPNRFSLVSGADGSNRDWGASPRAGYGFVYWDLQPGQALVIDMAEPQARYWSLQLMSPFWDTVDFNRHQSGLNGHQAVRDGDGRMRFVIALEDPGIANWLDPDGLPQGQCQLRTYDGAFDGRPEVRLTTLDKLHEVLPADTARVTADERCEAIRRRSRASLKRWHF